jgi:peptidoglycan/LPS O-acetylase OafA/YrhL
VTTTHSSSKPIEVSSNAQGHLYWLDWLRFVAALMVVAIHARGGIWVAWGRLDETSQTKLVAFFFALTRAGTAWVLVFFVLSGFLVGGKMIERLGNGTFNFREYAIDRFSRIWVPLVPALIWSALVAYWVGKPLSWLGLGGNMLGLQGVLCFSFAANNPLWSLAYEIWFYFLAGCMAVWVTTGDRGRLWAGLGLALGFAVFTKLDTVFLFAWLLGAATYWLCKRPPLPWLAASGVALMAAGYLCSQLRSATVSVDTSSWVRYAPTAEASTLILGLGMALLLPFLTQLKPKSNFGESVNSLGGKLAAFSYTLYLTHYPALYVWEHFLPDRHGAIDVASIVWYLLRIVSCVAFGWLCYLPFEKQTGRLRQWLRKNWGGNHRSGNIFPC